jgi:uncharacterized protein (DUF983 family)
MIDVRRVGRILGRGVHLRCPRCGAGPLFRGPFTMNAECLVCGLTFEREQGYFVGAIYVNYGATALLLVAGFFALERFTDISLAWQLTLWGAFAIAFPLGFFRHSRSLWMSLDYIVNPADESPPRGMGGGS